MNSNQDRYEIKKIKNLVKTLILKYGLEENSAEVFINALLYSDLCGVHTHGLSVLPAHLERIKRGGYNIKGHPFIEKETSAFSVVNANNTIGFISATYCMKIAIERCKDVGIYIVFSNNANTYGAAFYYSKLATDNGVIGINFCNSPSAMAAWGGREKILGTNPLSVGIPAGSNDPIIFDMSTSIVAKSKINEARKRGEKIPEGWALDCNGNPTTDPIEAIKGQVLPMAGAKGYGLALMIDIMAGLLSGAGFLNNVGRFYGEDNNSMNVGQIFIALDPRIIYSDKFYDMVDQYIISVHESGENVRCPGENKFISLKESIKKGVCLEKHVVEGINQQLKSIGISERVESNVGEERNTSN